MAAEKSKASGKNAAYDRLRKAIKEKAPARAYLFYGEESYLRQTYVQQLQELLIPRGSEDFNLHRLSGSRVTTQDVADAVESMPMMAPSTLVTVTDWDIFRLDESQRSQLTELLEDLPDYCTVVFIYDTVPYKPDRKMKKLTAAIDKNVEVVEFQGQSRDALVRWLQKRFRALDRSIDQQTADYMLFYCGSMMDNLIGEVNKVAAFAKAEQVTGTLTGYSSSSVVVGGTTYKFNKAASISSLSGAVDKEVTLTLDKYGFVLDVDASATSTNYAVVLKYSAGAGDFNDTPKVKLLFTDGTTEIVELTAAAKKTDGSTAVSEGDIVSYTINNKGKYTLKTLDDADTTTTAGSTLHMTTKGSSHITVDGVSAANGKTIFLVATKSGNSDTVYTSYTGIANVPTITAGSTAAKVNAYVKSGSAATVVYIDATAATTSVESSTKDVVFVKGSSTTGASYDTKKGTFYTYDAIVNGEITTIDSADKITSYALYTSMATDENGVVKLSADGSVFSGTGTDKAANDAIGLNGAYYSYSKDCQVFYIDSEGTISTSSIGGISKDETDGVWFKVTDGDVTTIVIKEAVSAAKTVISAAVKGNNIAVNPAATVDNTAKTIKFTVTGTAGNGDSVEITPTVSAGASASAVTLTYDGTAWSTATITVTAEDGTTADYVVSVA